MRGACLMNCRLAIVVSAASNTWHFVLVGQYCWAQQVCWTRGRRGHERKLCMLRKTDFDPSYYCRWRRQKEKGLPQLLESSVCPSV